MKINSSNVQSLAEEYKLPTNDGTEQHNLEQGWQQQKNSKGKNLLQLKISNHSLKEKREHI